MSKYARSLETLREKAVLFWPQEIIEKETSVSVLPLLLKTQDKFIGILNLADASPDAWKKLVDVSPEMKGNLFLKHLMVLSDLGGEALNKLPPLKNYFPNGQMTFFWRENKYEYQFKVIHRKIPLANAALCVDGKALLQGVVLNEKMEDVVMLLLYGAASVSDNLSEDIKNRCTIGSLIGHSEEIEKFVRQNYIRVSKQVAGASSNAMGQLAQDFVIEKLKAFLPNWKFVRNGTLPGVSHTGGDTETTFDVGAVSPAAKYFGIEVSFQFTTNSVIERKAGQAEARMNLVRAAGHKICYVIDGAGNINVRASAVRNICKYSDCTVAFSLPEIGVLAAYLQENANR
ncbi:MAG TPA: restriction endonuclease [Blastocatellia bacterium]|nr:restriction endonuclease [Blastocatellia bacterium]